MIVTDNTAEVLQEVDRLFTEKLKELQSLLKKATKDIVVVKSGDLKRSIIAEVQGDKLTLGSPLPYAAKVEMDKPYLRPALLRSKMAIKKIFKAD